MTFDYATDTQARLLRAHKTKNKEIRRTILTYMETHEPALLPDDISVAKAVLTHTRGCGRWVRVFELRSGQETVERAWKNCAVEHIQ